LLGRFLIEKHEKPIKYAFKKDRFKKIVFFGTDEL